VSFLLALALATTRSGLYGMVSRGPTAPVCRVGQPCSAPASGATLLFRRNGHVAARVHVRKNGRYSVHLAPGYYGVVVEPKPQIGRGIEPRHVHVVAGSPRERDFRIDTGIR